MTEPIRYDPAAARRLLEPGDFGDLEQRLLAARDDVFEDVSLLGSGHAIPAERQPLDAGFIELPKRLLAEDEADGEASLLAQIEAAASELCGEVDRVVSLGIGGSYMGARALFEALCHPFHNELSRQERNGAPRLYFEGNNLDNDSLSGLLGLLKTHCTDKSDLNQRWGIVVISKSGGTLETAVAFRLFREALDDYYGQDSQESRRLVVPITGYTGKLRNLSTNKQYPHIFPIPDNVGGRYSVFTAVGLLPAAVLKLDVRQLLEGASEMTERCRRESPGNNPVLDYVAICHLMEKRLGRNIRVLSTWGSRLESLGLWYDQLLSESLGKQEQGATPITAVNTRDLHSRGQQHQEGARDKLITNVIVEPTARMAVGSEGRHDRQKTMARGWPPASETAYQAVSQAVAVPKAADDADDLNRLAGKTIPELLGAAVEGTNRAYADDDRPTSDILLPRLDEYALGELLQMFMLATVIEGRLIGINPYGQPGVEAYKRNMTEILNSR